VEHAEVLSSLPVCLDAFGLTRVAQASALEMRAVLSGMEK